MSFVNLTIAIIARQRLNKPIAIPKNKLMVLALLNIGIIAKINSADTPKTIAKIRKISKIITTLAPPAVLM